MLNIEINGTVLQVKLNNNSSAQAIKELLKEGSLALPMKDYAHMEKFGRLGKQLPRNDEHITALAGDVILSEGNLLVIYYAPNTWNFTRLGKVQNKTGKELRKILRKGNITATLSLQTSKGEH